MTIHTKRQVSHDEAVEIAKRFIDGHFNNPGDHARVSIPANPERDDDLLLLAYIEQQRKATGWQTIDTAPKDGTLIQLFVTAVDSSTSDNPTEDAVHGWRTIGMNNFDNDGEDKWQTAGWCWSNDHFTEGHGRPTHWQAQPEVPKP